MNLEVLIHKLQNNISLRRQKFSTLYRFKLLINRSSELDDKYSEKFITEFFIPNILRRFTVNDTLIDEEAYSQIFPNEDDLQEHFVQEGIYKKMKRLNSYSLIFLSLNNSLH